MKLMDHNELAHSLALHLRADSRMVWEDIVSGPAGSVRPDVFTMEKSFANPNPISYEVKVSVPDFRSDITKAKWKAYHNFSYGVVFAAPKGLISLKDVPTGCGFIQHNGTIWHTVKKPTLSPCAIDNQMLLKLLIDGDRQQTRPKPIQNRDFNSHHHHETLRKKFGQDISQKLSFIEEYPSMKKELNALKTELKKVLGLDDINKWCFLKDAKYAIENIKIMADEHKRKQAIAEELKALGAQMNGRLNRIITEYTTKENEG